MMFSHSLASERATTATTGSVWLQLNTSCGTPGSMKMKSPASFSTTCLSPGPYSCRTRACDAARRNGSDIHRQVSGRDVVGRQAHLVLDAVPVPASHALADHRNTGVAFHETLQVLGHGSPSAAKIR